MNTGKGGKQSVSMNKKGSQNAANMQLVKGGVGGRLNNNRRKRRIPYYLKKSKAEKRVGNQLISINFIFSGLSKNHGLSRWLLNIWLQSKYKI